jgi:hypothetical protein
MQERKPSKRWHHTARSGLTLRISDMKPGASLTLRVVEPHRRRDRKRRAGRNRVVIERTEGVVVDVEDDLTRSG